MDAVIEIRGDEFTNDVFERIKALIANRSDTTVRIAINGAKSFPPKETKEEYFERLNRSIKQLEEGKVITFTWEAFEEYSKQMLNEP